VQVGGHAVAAELFDPLIQVPCLRRPAEHRRGQLIRTSSSRVIRALMRRADGSDKAGSIAATAASSAPERSRTVARSMLVIAFAPNQCPLRPAGSQVRRRGLPSGR
jgi:hypothetical protein